MTDDVKKSKLRELYAYKTKLTEKLDGLSKERKKKDDEIEEVVKKLAGVESSIHHLENRRFLITTHFIERWRERVDPEGTEESIRIRVFTDQFLKMVETLGDGSFPIGEGIDVKIADRKLITVTTPLPKVTPIYKQIKKVRIKPRKWNN